ncbi:MAG: hypothetical protein HOQ24_05470, partial [Mycobacteriaceae bacterium]|nr:hypothetical protein [Mycobacteriaceae bacterium]
MTTPIPTIPAGPPGQVQDPPVPGPPVVEPKRATPLSGPPGQLPDAPEVPPAPPGTQGTANDPLIGVLMQPLVALRTSLGKGDNAGAVTGPLRQASTQLEQGVETPGRSATNGLESSWPRGQAGRGAVQTARSLNSAAGQISDRGTAMADSVDRALRLVVTARGKLDQIVQECRTALVGQAKVLHTPPGMSTAIATAQDFLARGMSVTSHLLGDLDAEARAVWALMPPPDQVPGVPAPGSDSSRARRDARSGDDSSRESFEKRHPLTDKLIKVGGAVAGIGVGATETVIKAGVTAATQVATSAISETAHAVSAAITQAIQHPPGTPGAPGTPPAPGAPGPDGAPAPGVPTVPGGRKPAAPRA